MGSQHDMFAESIIQTMRQPRTGRRTRRPPLWYLVTTRRTRQDAPLATHPDETRDAPVSTETVQR